jgi:hypothetical protein
MTRRIILGSKHEKREIVTTRLHTYFVRAPRRYPTHLPVLCHSPACTLPYLAYPAMVRNSHPTPYLAYPTVQAHPMP